VQLDEFGEGGTASIASPCTIIIAYPVADSTDPLVMLKKDLVNTPITTSRTRTAQTQAATSPRWALGIGY